MDILPFIVPVVVAVIGAIPAYLTLRQSKKNNKQATDIAATSNLKMDATKVKTDDLVKKTDEIHTLTNSHLSAVTADLAIANAGLIAANDRIKHLEELVTSIVTPKAEASGKPLT